MADTSQIGTRATSVGGRMRLRIESGADRGQQIVLPDDGPLVIGRGDDVDYRLFDDRASRRHCELVPRPDGVGRTLRDLGSRNGTWINGRRVDERDLRAGDRFTIGSTTFRLVADGMGENETVVTLAGATSIKSAIDGARQDELASRVDQSNRLAELFRLQSSLDAERGLATLLDGALARIGSRELLASDTVMVRVFGDGPDNPDRIARRYPDGDPMELADDLLARVRTGGEALLLTEVASQIRSPGADTDRRPLTAAMLVPIKQRQSTCALLYVDRRGGSGFSPDDLSFAVQVASVLAPAIRTAARVDDLRESASGARVSSVIGDEPTTAIVGNSEALRACLRTVAKVAPTDVAVLIAGETGTGKELFARALHEQSAVRDGPFVALNCAAIPADLLEAELFGHEAGAFTGANRARAGKFELADGGTLFLDEIGETPAEMQAKLLRVLQERSFYRLGGQTERQVRVRLVTASNRDLQEEVKAGRFREDLLFRIRVVTIDLPPLRERRDDVPELAGFFLRASAHRLSRKADRFDEPALAALQKWDWPGNVRELENVVERAVVLADGAVIGTAALPAEIASGKVPVPAGDATSAWEDDGFPEAITLREAERRAIITALRATGGKKGETAKLLGTSWPTLNKKIKDYDIDVDAITAD